MTDTKKIGPFVENIAESTAACLVTMLQGNLLAISLSHWVIASQTGIAAGLLASIALLISRARSRWVVAVLLGVTTAIVDFFVHRGMFGSVVAEAIVTGIAAAVLSYLTGMALATSAESA
ncbi:MAG: hypothetical protein ACJ0SL_06735 [Candidatus Rariloculaceae bacterium]